MREDARTKDLEKKRKKDGVTQARQRTNPHILDQVHWKEVVHKHPWTRRQ